MCYKWSAGCTHALASLEDQNLRAWHVQTMQTDEEQIHADNPVDRNSTSCSVCSTTAWAKRYHSLQIAQNLLRFPKNVQYWTGHMPTRWHLCSKREHVLELWHITAETGRKGGVLYTRDWLWRVLSNGRPETRRTQSSFNWFLTCHASVTMAPKCTNVCSSLTFIGSLTFSRWIQ